jgi:protein gp37
VTGIQWTDQVWNPTTGCDRISSGCDNCYALTMARRLKGMGQAKYQADGDPRTSGPGFGLTVHPDTLTLPYTWRTPRRVFVNSMSDLFHARVPLDFIRRVFDVIADTPQHTYQVLTKRAARLPKVADRLPWPRNLWMGVSVEDQEQADLRIPRLLEALDGRDSLAWISAEPLLGPVDLSAWLKPCPLCDGWGERHRPPHVPAADPMHRYLGECDGCGGTGGWGLDWVVVGGESGRGARPMAEEWAATIAAQCEQAGVPLFFKQAGRQLAKTWGCADPKGGKPDEWPRPWPREFPRTAAEVTA